MDDSLENKFRLAAIVAPLDRRMKRKHLAIYGFILDWYHHKYGDALASVRHIVAQLKERDPDGVGLYMGDVHSALGDLVSWGYLTQEKGAGRRASRYVPVWVHSRSVHKTPNATENEISVRETQNTSVRETPNATSDSVHKSPNEDPSTLTRVPDPGTGKDGHDCAPASPPPTAGPDGATAAECAQGFEELWRAYGYRQKKADAKAAYKKLAPDQDLHRRLVEAARSWQASWAAQGKADAPRFTLAKWIDREEFECDPPTAYKAKERKKAPARQRLVRRHVTVSDIVPTQRGYDLTFDFNDCDDGDVPTTTQSYDVGAIRALYDIAGIVIRKPGDEDMLIGRDFVLVIDEDDAHSFERSDVRIAA